MNPLLQQIKNTPLAGNIGSLLVIQLLNYAIPVIIIPVMIGALGDGGYGVFSYAQYFAALLMFVCDYGFAYTGPQQVSQNQDNRVYLGRIFSTITAIRFCLFIICSLITVAFAFAFSASEQEKHALLLSIMGLAGSVLLPNWFLQGAQKLRAFAVLNVLFKLTQVALIWILIDGKEDLELACILFFGSNFLLGVAAFVLVLRSFGIGLRWPARYEIKEQLHKGYQMFLAVFFSSVYINGTGVILFGNLGNLLGNNLFIQLGWQRYTVMVMLLMAVINTTGVYFLASAYAATGAAIALCTTEVLAPLLFIAVYQVKKRQGA